MTMLAFKQIGVVILEILIQSSIFGTLFKCTVIILLDILTPSIRRFAGERPFFLFSNVTDFSQAIKPFFNADGQISQNDSCLWWHYCSQ